MDASLSTLALSIGSSAAIALGLAPNPKGGDPSIDMEMARFNIDLLGMLEEKTRGNRTDDEEKLLMSMLQELRMKFIQSPHQKTGLADS